MLISKKNDVYLHIETNQAIAQELSDYFTFEVPGANMMHFIKRYNIEENCLYHQLQVVSQQSFMRLLDTYNYQVLMF